MSHIPFLCRLFHFPLENDWQDDGVIKQLETLRRQRDQAIGKLISFGSLGGELIYFPLKKNMSQKDKLWILVSCQVEKW